MPKRTVVGDTVRVVGSGFGSNPAGSVVLFPSEAQDVEATIVSWSANEIAVLVPGPAPAPDSTIVGLVHVVVDSTESNGFSFAVAPRIVTFEGDPGIANDGDVEAIFDAHGCYICHKAPAFDGLVRLTPWTTLMGRTPAVVIPRRSGASRLWFVLQPTTDESLRMPDFGSGYDYLDPSEILVISDWIDQGARDN